MGRYIISDKFTYSVAAGANIKIGDQIYMDSDGYAAPGAAPATGLTGTVIGSAAENVDNTSGADGAATVLVEKSCGNKFFLFTGVSITSGDAGKTCYVGATPQTVTKTATNAITSGTIDGVEDDGRVRVIFNL